MILFTDKYNIRDMRESIERLNSRFGAPGRIVFRPGFAGYPNVVIANKYGSAEIALLGANILDYRPTGVGPVIFRPAKRDYNRGDSFHGGVPVCWPQFGNRFSKEIPQHGFARKMIFEVRSSEYSEEKTEVVLGISSDEETRKIWPFDFDLEYTVSVTMKLNMSLSTRNKSDTPFSFSCGLHPYLRVSERDGALVKGLDGLVFFDGLTGTPDLTHVGDFALNRDVDHIFAMKEAPKHEYAVIDSGMGRAKALVSSGNDSAVVWNPGPETSLPDFEKDDWRKFVCVEPVSDWPRGRTLEPGAQYVLSASIQCVLKQDLS